MLIASIPFEPADFGSLGQEITYILYSETTGSTLSHKLGVAEYSYFFVRELFRVMLAKFSTVIVVTNPESEVDGIYDDHRSNGRRCIFLSFAPPHRTCINIRCPTIPIFAWEFDSIPDENWDADPRNDWTFVLSHFGHAITHSEYSVKAVRAAMGHDFPVISIPAPQWNAARSINLPPFANLQPIELELDHLVDSTRVTPRSRAEINLVETNKAVGIRRHYNRMRRSLEKRWRRSTRYNAAQTLQQPDKRARLRIDAGSVVFTSVFNPYDGRKNWQDTLTAFHCANAERADAILVLKLVCSNSRPALEDIKSWISRLPPRQCQIYAIGDFLDAGAYAALIQATTFAVNTSFCEGQCLPLMEFMACGKPAIAPRHTGMFEILNEEVAFLIESSREFCIWPQDPRDALRAHRHRINWESAVEAFSEAYKIAVEQPGRYRTMAQSAVELLRAHCSDDVVYSRLKRFVVETIKRRAADDAADSTIHGWGHPVRRQAD